MYVSSEHVVCLCNLIVGSVLNTKNRHWLLPLGDMFDTHPVISFGGKEIIFQYMKKYRQTLVFHKKGVFNIVPTSHILTERQTMWLHTRGGRTESDVLWHGGKPFVKMFVIKKKPGTPAEMWKRGMSLVRVPDEKYLEERFDFKREGEHVLISRGDI